ncbi:N-acetylmuramoyl-L-alanine amidase [Actinobacillus equuli]|uniref:N-acetylmuramoyl-L-alanine amidase n=1 Tax=Actinobacillus equuli TaxID=718 RepID=A0AAX3FHX3_ACTEU|nr:N-acetylmuramoyl-L-alanine amidase [Actinobacillus equuli]AIZ79374.1 N-acetylmuramoyl-L-alanine amidase [Actinobacillus equuli subsp. equuli]WGE43491.1 N-acetylmuramoyl-L-alanine amidase [Actinobacillus equuli subsp. equuli]VEE89822.1 N-acetylmuramoyl-L-alanine amidase [Actinobacillus equuli]
MNKLVNYIAVSLFGLFFSLSSYAKTVVVVDAGHGGKDPGAIGATLGIKEKNVTLAISKELKALLDSNPKFKAVMTRKSDYFIQLPERTEIARKNKANLLVSIHADSSPKSNSLKGASVWVLSNRRASDEMGKWLEDHEKQSELLGGAGSVLSNTNEKYLNQTVLDLQFSHSQRSGYELGKTVLSRLGNVTSLAKSAPQHASLSVLRSPDITSILVETGFLSNPVEEQKLATPAYRRKIAQAIYNGLVAYVSRHSGNTKAIYKEVKETSADTDKKETKEKKADRLSEKSSKKDNLNNALKANKNDNSKTKVEEKSAKDNKKNSKDKESNSTKREPQKSSNGYHIVQQDETLYSIARIYNTTPEKLSKLNNIKNNKITVGKKLKVQ